MAGDVGAPFPGMANVQIALGVPSPHASSAGRDEIVRGRAEVSGRLAEATQAAIAEHSRATREMG